MTPLERAIRAGYQAAVKAAHGSPEGGTFYPLTHDAVRAAAPAILAVALADDEATINNIRSMFPGKVDSDLIARRTLAALRRVFDI